MKTPNKFHELLGRSLAAKTQLAYMSKDIDLPLCRKHHIRLTVADAGEHAQARLLYRHAYPPHPRKDCGGVDPTLNAIRPAPVGVVYGGRSCGGLRWVVRDVAVARRVAKPLDVPRGALRTGLVVRADTPA